MPENQTPADSNLWPGLEPYTGKESHRFFGRRAEVAELLERVSRRIVTVLFAQSGVGKTSLLKAGAFPGMKKQGLQPVYLRLDHGPDAPSLTAQIWSTLEKENLLGVEYRQSQEDHTLWEWCHDNRQGLLSERTKSAIPVLVLDQFEELFTIGSATAARRGMVEAFLEELADLVENRIPLSFQAKIDEDEDFDLDRYDIDADSYRIVLALREDYLSLLDRERTRMPMVMQNRMLLDRLFGEAAMQVVTGPAPELLPDGVPEMIVRHVAGDDESELHLLQVEPALLSLVCRELDLARGGRKITTELLTGHKDEILSRFYERCFEEIPNEAREFVEENLVTESGHRQSLVAIDVAHTIGQDTLDALISRRLLRTEQHGQTPKIELTHDVLVPLVVESRTAARERAMRLEAKQKEDEATANLQQERKRRQRMAWGFVLAVGVALAAILFGVLSVLYRSDLVAANQELREKEQALLENRNNLVNMNQNLEAKEKFLTEANAKLIESKKKADSLARDLQIALQNSRKAEQEATSARQNSESYLAHFMERASALVGDATSEAGGMGPRTRMALLIRAQKMYESLEELVDVDDPKNKELSSKIQKQLFAIRIGEAAAAMSSLDHRGALQILEKTQKDLDPLTSGAAKNLTLQVKELQGDVYWDLAGRFHSRASTRDLRGEAGVEALVKKGNAHYQKAIEAYDKALGLTTSDELAEVRIRNKLANTKRRLRKWDEAETLLNQSLAELEKRASRPDSEEDRSQLKLKADTLHKMGNIHWDRAIFGVRQGEHPEALRDYQAAVAIRRKLLADAPDNPKAKYDLALSIANTSDVLVRSRMPEGLAQKKEGYPLYRERVELARSLYENNPENPFYRRFHANGLRFLAMKYLDSNDLKNYVTYAEKAVFVDRFQNSEYLKTYSDALNHNDRREEMKAINSMIGKLEEIVETEKASAQ